MGASRRHTPVTWTSCTTTLRMPRLRPGRRPSPGSTRGRASTAILSLPRARSSPRPGSADSCSTGSTASAAPQARRRSAAVVPGVSAESRPGSASELPGSTRPAPALRLARGASFAPTFIHRDYLDLYSDRIDLSTGQSPAGFRQRPRSRVISNSAKPTRRYTAVQTQFSWRFAESVQVAGSYTWSRLTGNFPRRGPATISDADQHRRVSRVQGGKLELPDRLPLRPRTDAAGRRPASSSQGLADLSPSGELGRSRRRGSGVVRLRPSLRGGRIPRPARVRRESGLRGAAEQGHVLLHDTRFVPHRRHHTDRSRRNLYGPPLPKC